jgi:hypothetical protein
MKESKKKRFRERLKTLRVQARLERKKRLAEITGKAVN